MSVNRGNLSISNDHHQATAYYQLKMIIIIRKNE